MSVVATTRRLGNFQLSFHGLSIGSFLTFKGLFTSYLAKTPTKCLVLCLLTFQQCRFNLPMGPRSFWYLFLEISMLILFRNLEPPCLLLWSVPSPSPQLSSNPLHPVSQMETSLFLISPPISTMPFPQFILRNWIVITPHMR